MVPDESVRTVLLVGILMVHAVHLSDHDHVGHELGRILGIFLRLDHHSVAHFDVS